MSEFVEVSPLAMAMVSNLTQCKLAQGATGECMGIL